MDRRMRVFKALILLIISSTPILGFVAGADGPISYKEALENDRTTLSCDSTPDTADDELMLLVWYKDNDSIYSYDARAGAEWCNNAFNFSGRVITNMTTNPTTLTIKSLREDDQALYHCRVEFLLSPTRNIGVNLTVIVLPSEPFFLDELGNTVTNKTRPYYEGDTLVLNCLVIGGRPPPKITWYSGETLVDATYSVSDIPNVRQNELYLPLTRDNAEVLSCRATNTNLVPPLEANLQIEMYLPAINVTIQWIHGATNGVLNDGVPAIAQCIAYGSYPVPDLIWSLNHKHLTEHSNQTYDDTLQTVISRVEFTPTAADNEGIISCEAVNPVMPKDKSTKIGKLVLNVTFAPIVKIVKLDDERNEVIELDALRLKCIANANPPPNKFIWYYNDREVKDDITGEVSNELVIEEVSRRNAGRYSCAATNTLGETRAESINIVVLYPPLCTKRSITFNKETLTCNVESLPVPDTYFWHIHQAEYDVQHLTTGSPSLSLHQVSGPFSESLNVSCEAENGIASQETPCRRTIRINHLKPSQPQECDLVFEYKEFHIRCVPVENATYYELSLWRLSTTNTSLVLDQKRSIEVGGSMALMQDAGEPWLVRGRLGLLNAGDEAGAAACNRYGCSSSVLLRPSEVLLNAVTPPWWKFFTGKDVGISIGVVLLVVMFICSTILAIRLARRAHTKAPAPVIQVLQLDDVTRDYLNRTGDRVRRSCSLRSNISDYSEEYGDSNLAGFHYPQVNPHDWIPPPDVTLTLQRESAV